MKSITILGLAALSAAFVIPDEQVFSQIAVESRQNTGNFLNDLPSGEQIVHEVEEFLGLDSSIPIDQKLENLWNDGLDDLSDAGEQLFSGVECLSSETPEFTGEDSHHGPPHKDPHHGHGDHGHHGHHKHRGHHGPPHKSNLTVYQLIAESNYTTKLAKLINKYDDLVELLNGTSANFTVFAPTDHAFEKLPDHAKDLPAEVIKKVLGYHVSADFYPALKVLASPTIPTLLITEYLPGPQRLKTDLGLKGLTLNYYSRVIGVNYFGSNGVIHGIDSVLVPPPKAASILGFLPGEFSTLELGLYKTGLFAAINDTSNHVGGTIFAPSNFAFKRLGPRITGFLFSKYGEKYLKALLKYHIVANQTLYSDAFYPAKEAESEQIPKGVFHVELPTLLKDRSLSVDLARWGRFISFKINAFTEVSFPNGVAKDGVIQVVPNVLIPPKSVNGELLHHDGSELEVDDLVERLDAFVDEDHFQFEL